MKIFTIKIIEGRTNRESDKEVRNTSKLKMLQVQYSFTVSIFSLNGEFLIKKNIKTQIDISDLNKGVYFVELSNESYKSFHKLIVKK